MPSIKTIDDIKSSLLRPSLTSHYYVELALPGTGGNNSTFTDKLKSVGISLTKSQDTLNLLCSEASLPGSSLATLEINNDRTGVTERHAHRKFFDDRIDLTFYVDAEEYLPILFFESWIKYVTGSGSSDSNNEKAKEYFYRMNFADEYTSDQGLTVTKFERDTYKGGDEKWNASGSGLVYTFIRSFPISITSMPVSYESSNLLKCTVSMSYIRYIVQRLSSTPPTQSPDTQSKTTPANKNILTQKFLDQNGQFTLPSQNIA